ncbi:MAG: tRNA lysidine(34) synthetase TilS, partial [Deltaproteobacteria bacterium]|nr:tRNA lysidine(34) synthetase TilS [Deltaproteobacteria bacterium]
AIPPPGLPTDKWEAIFDLASLTGRLAVRNFRRGDRFAPLGLNGHRKKVKDLFIDNKVPLPARVIWPILVMGEEILWLPQYGRSEVGKITPNTREYLRVKATIPVA